MAGVTEVGLARAADVLSSRDGGRGPESHIGALFYGTGEHEVGEGDAAGAVVDVHGLFAADSFVQGSGFCWRGPVWIWYIELQDWQVPVQHHPGFEGVDNDFVVKAPR